MCGMVCWACSGSWQGLSVSRLLILWNVGEGGACDFNV